MTTLARVYSINGVEVGTLYFDTMTIGDDEKMLAQVCEHYNTTPDEVVVTLQTKGR